MKSGIHEKKFSIDNSFFKHFEESMIKSGKFEVLLELDKRSDLIEMNFDITGDFETVCDRCTAQVDFPLNTQTNLLVKYSEENVEEPNVLYITRDTHHINISKFIYDSICLSIPLMKVFDCQQKEPFPCDEAVLEKLDDFSEEAIENKDEKANPIWEELKRINFDNK